MRGVKKLLPVLLPILLVAPTAPPGAIRLYVGTYTDGASKGIYRLLLDPATGQVTPDGPPTETVSPSFLALSQDGTRLFAVNETGESATDLAGGVTSLSVDPATGALAVLGRVSSSGPAPCHLSLDKGDRHVLVANYWGGSVAVFPVQPDGRLGEATAFVRHTGLNPTPRDPGPHAHAILTGPHEPLGAGDGPGARQGVRVSLRRRARRARPRSAPGRDGEGRGATAPRVRRRRPGRLRAERAERHRGLVRVRSADGSLAASIRCRRWRRATRARTSSAEAGALAGRPVPVRVEPRPDDIAIFEILRPSRRLRLAGRQATGGRHPRHFAIEPGGRFLVVANRDSDSLWVYRIDAATGLLSYASGPVSVPKPVCVLMRKAGP
jgi:6-phosphogluconolactonase